MQTLTKSVRMISCPTCGDACEFSPTNRYRPFCSERCKMVDLGEWATEKFRIADTAPPDHQELE